MEKELGHPLRDGLSSQAMEPQASPPKASIPDAFPCLAYEGGYPEDEDFFAFKLIPFNFYSAASWLLEELPRAAEMMPCYCDIERREKDYLVAFSTGGWSGAESITNLIERRADMSYFMQSWKRGGHYVFEIPFRFLTPPNNTPQTDYNDYTGWLHDLLRFREILKHADNSEKERK